MAMIDVSRNHTIGKDAARAAAEAIAEQLKDKIAVTYRWDGDDLRFERTGATGRIHVSDTVVRVIVELAFMLRPLKSKIEQKVHKYLDESLSG